MTTLHSILAAAFSLALDPLEAAIGPAPTLVAVAIVSTALLLVALRALTDPERLRERRRRAEAELLVLRLWGHEPATILAAGGKFVANLARYLVSHLGSVAVLIAPAGLLFAHLDARYTHRALLPGEAAVIEAVAPGEWTLDAEGSLAIEAGPVDVAERSERSWRVRATSEKSGRLLLRGDGGALTVEVPVSQEPRGVAALRRVRGVASLVLAPAHPPIDPKLDLESVRIRFPSLELAVGPWRSSWWVVFLIVSLGVGLALRRPLGIE